jgi:glycosyltransferase involved in cell wall biosynthesis
VLKRLKQIKPKFERQIIVLIPSYNNKEWYAMNLASVFAQKYTNYHVIYVDDNSTDGTGDLVAQYIKDHKIQDKITFIRNQERLGPLANRYYPIHSCPDHAIIVNLDGDDCWLTDDMLSIINKAYEDPNVWLTYGQFVNWPSNKLGYGKAFPKKIIKNRSYRKYHWVTGQSRTFYAWLFKQIKKEDLMLDGKFFTAATDVAMMIPLMEMVGEKHLFIPDVLYLRNVATDINIFKTNKKVQKMFGKIVANGNKYQQIKTLPFNTLKGAILNTP